ncbi:MurR/RpiR family transcriptional regulator [Rhodovulum marinum]|uniref:RpiR family transcriptional regulator n=1 Tax=Rhodovulum marinum TaxID=320662 RepID=A0A4R2Q671_9RHOB|nr:MurR/RpiR family transcriptional regulator [Rhodovulum marinum]TCP44322.1 RpiR family transcriptional regulator [Rhodovulum marinum]
MPKSEADRPSLTRRIHEAYRALPAGERRAADIVLAMPGELAVWSASELADRAAVSNATISRFVRRLGYRSFEEARREARTMRAAGSPLYLAERAGADGPSDALTETLATETALLQATLAQLDGDMLDRIAMRLARARRVRFAGFRNSHVAADFGRRALAQMRPDVEMLNAPGQTLAEGIAGVSAEDAVIIVGLRRRPAGFGRFVRAVAATGADIVLLADPGIREAPAEVRWTLVCPVETQQTLDSYVGAIAVLRLVALATMGRLGPAARDHLERIESIHDALDELDG